jgi:type IV fimbrial biogenesis protein FimT
VHAGTGKSQSAEQAKRAPPNYHGIVRKFGLHIEKPPYNPDALTSARMPEVMKKPCGYGLVELLIALTILAITASIAIPTLEQLLENQRKTQTLNQMIGALGYTRSAAVFSRMNTSLCAGQADCSGSPAWAQRLIIFHDINANGRREPDEFMLREETLSDGYNWYWASFRKLSHITFEADGTSRAANGTLTLCKAGQPKRQIVINLAGRIRHQAPTARATCN